MENSITEALMTQEEMQDRSVAPRSSFLGWTCILCSRALMGPLEICELLHEAERFSFLLYTLIII
jgi:hypothetical protein